MIGLTILVAFAVYLLVCFFVVRGVARWARRRGRSGWRWGIAAGLFMYLLVFWDHIPTLVLYKYYCHTKAGFWVYKTPNEWKAENPRVSETLTWRENSPRFEDEEFGSGVRLNERFAWINEKKKKGILPIWIYTKEIIDIKKNETVLKIVFVKAGYPGGFSSYRFWTSYSHETKIMEFYKFTEAFEKLGREVK